MNKKFLYTIIAFLVSSAFCFSSNAQSQVLVLKQLNDSVLVALPDSVAAATAVLPDSIDDEYDSPLLNMKLNDWRTLDYDTIYLVPDYMFVPLIFERQESVRDTLEISADDTNPYVLKVDRSWLDDALSKRERTKKVRYQAITSNPQLVLYNVNSLPEPPKKFVIVTDPAKNMLKLEEYAQQGALTENKRDPIKYRNWKHSFDASIQFSQTYLSNNWYQGGNKNINALGDVKWVVELNQNLHPNYLFTNTVRYRVGVNSTPNDTLRSYNLSEDLLQINTVVGVKAIKKWYYSANMQFKTQLFHNYNSNSSTRMSSFMSSGELNLGLGVTYNHTSKDGYKSVSLSIAPASYNMKTCFDDMVAETRFGIEEGKHVRHNIGSNIECKFMCKFNPNISWNSRLYAFSDYHFLQGDWENTIDFSVTRHLTTRIYLHLRYDSSRPKDKDWKYWQLKEMLSFGLTWRFSTI